MDFLENYIKNIILREGVLYNKDNNSFSFDFNLDTNKDVITLSNADLKSIEYKNRIYVYGYSLREDGIESSRFVSWLKDQLNNNKCTEDISKFIYNAIYWLNRDFNLNKFKCIIYPDTRQNKLVEKIIRYIKDLLFDYESPTTYYSIIKNLPSKIKFDWEAFKEDNKKLYQSNNNEHIIKVESRINNLLEVIHRFEYFRLHKCGFNVNERQYLRNFLTLDSKEEYITLQNLKNTDRVLLVDDTITSGTTIDEMIRSIYTINPNCEIVIFTLIKGKDGKF